MTQIQVRRGTATQWASADPVLGQGEFGYEVDTYKLKIGDGSTAWTGLAYIALNWDTLPDRPTYVAAGFTKADARAAIDLGNVDNTSDATKNAASAALTNKDLTSGTNTFPTSLATLTGAQALTNKDLSSATNTLPTSVVTLTGSQQLDNKTLKSPTVTDYTETVNVLGTVASAATINLTAGTVVTATLTSATPCTFTMPTAAAGKSFVLMLKQAASGTATTATFTNVKWGAAGTPTITATVGKMDILSFFSDGTNWYGSVTAGYTP